MNVQVNSMLHIGLIGPLPPPFGGMANQTKQLLHLLHEDRWVQVELVQTNAPYPFKLIANIKGVRAIFRMLPYLYKIWRLAGNVQVMHVFANSGWSWQLFAAPVLWIGWLRKTPVIINYRGGYARDYFSKSLRWIKPSMNKSDAIIVPSEYLKNVFSEFNFDVDVIPNIINLEKFKPKGQLQSAVEGHPHLIVARNLESIYGIKTAIDAAKLLKESYPNLKLSIAGSGPQRDELKQYIRQAGLEENVILTGKLDPDEMVSLYHSADIMINPTTVDNMPNAILESMACGVPVVTTNVGGIPYIVKNESTALMVEVNNPVEMAKQVRKLCENPILYQTLVANGIAEIKQYSWTKIRQQWLSLYEQMKEVR